MAKSPSTSCSTSSATLRSTEVPRKVAFSPKGPATRRRTPPFAARSTRAYWLGNEGRQSPLFAPPFVLLFTSLRNGRRPDSACAKRRPDRSLRAARRARAADVARPHAPRARRLRREHVREHSREHIARRDRPGSIVRLERDHRGRAGGVDP